MPVETNESKGKILIVEDEVLIAADLQSRLKNLGYTVYGKATSGKKAMELLAQYQPDLVLMDIVIQGEMDGIETAEVIRDKWGIPVVFLTAFADAGRLERAKLTYPFGYLLKPFQDRDLKITVEMALYVAKVDAERRQTEQRNGLSMKVLELLNSHSDLESGTDIIRQIINLIKKVSGFEAVGIRLKDGEDFPYYEAVGFPVSFIAAEKYLCARDDCGAIIRDNIGNPVP